jgi:hypothetical protein
MLLPKDREIKEIIGSDIAGFMEAAEEVGGDYYDVLQHKGRVKIGRDDVYETWMGEWRFNDYGSKGIPNLAR